MNKKIAKWRKELTELVTELEHVLRGGLMSLRLQESENLDPFYNEWVLPVYYYDAASVVRRLLDKDKQTRSLKIIADEVISNAHLLDKKAFIKELVDHGFVMRPFVMSCTLPDGEKFNSNVGSILYEQHISEWEHEFDHFDVVVNGCVDPNIIKKLCDDAVCKGKPVKDWVDKHIAHYDEDRKKYTLKFKELDEALDCTAVLCRCLCDLLTVCKPKEKLPDSWEWIFHEHSVKAK